MTAGGAKPNMKLQSVGNRGLRSPRHIGMIAGHRAHFLHPWMAAPVRPGETFVGASIQGESWLNSVIQAPMAPMMYAEIGLFYIPLIALGDWYARLITATGDDIEDATSGTFSGPGSVSFADTANEPGLQIGPVDWAGEPGDTLASDTGAAKIPVSSHGTYKIAEDWYGVNNYVGVGDENRYSNPPLVDGYISSASRKRIDLQGFADADPSGSQSVATMLDTLSLLTKMEMSYAEYLAAHGVDPRKSDAMSMPLMLNHGALTSTNPEFAHGVGINVNDAQDNGSGYDSSSGGGRVGSVPTSETNQGFLYGVKPMSSYMKRWDTYRRKPVRFNHPGILLGTCVFYVEVAHQTDGGAYLDATRLINGGLWGDRSLGGVEETDFMAVLDYFPRDGTQDDQSAWNFLNLYVNGDNFAYGQDPETDDQPFDFRDPTGRSIGDTPHISCTTKLSAQLHILSDLIG